MDQKPIETDDMFMLASQRWNRLTDSFVNLVRTGTEAEITAWVTTHEEILTDHIPSVVRDLLSNPQKCDSRTLPVLACRYIDLWWALSRHADDHNLTGLSTALYQQFNLILGCIYYINTLDENTAFHEYRVVEILGILYNYGLDLARIAGENPEELELWENSLEVFELALDFIETYSIVSPNEYNGGQVDFSISRISADPTVSIFVSELRLQIIHIKLVMNSGGNELEPKDSELIEEIGEVESQLQTCITFMQQVDSTMLTQDNATITLAQALLVSCYAMIAFNSFADSADYSKLHKQVTLTLNAYTQVEYSQQHPELSALNYIIFHLAHKMVLHVAEILSQLGDDDGSAANAY